MNIAKLEAEVLALPLDERASLAHRLLLSLDEHTEAEHDRLWGEESARRAAAFDAGAAQTISVP